MNVQTPILQKERARGSIDLRMGVDGLRDLHQSGSLRALRPRRNPHLAALVNTSGGMTSGDQFAVSLALDPKAQLAFTTQAAERIYQCPDVSANVVNNIKVGTGGRIEWLPLETIVFDNAKLDRWLKIELAHGAEALICESIVFGRHAMGEVLRDLAISDRYEIIRNGEPLYIDQLRYNETLLTNRFALDNAQAIATVISVSAKAEALEISLRSSDHASRVGISRIDDVLIIRLLGADSRLMKADLAQILEVVSNNLLPMTWRI